MIPCVMEERCRGLARIPYTLGKHGGAIEAESITHTRARTKILKIPNIYLRLMVTPINGPEMMRSRSLFPFV